MNRLTILLVLTVFPIIGCQAPETNAPKFEAVESHPEQMPSAWLIEKTSPSDFKRISKNGAHHLLTDPTNLITEDPRAEIWFWKETPRPWGYHFGFCLKSGKNITHILTVGQVYFQN
ncbi:hypothetical protein [Geothrix rubra]|uniref:hypothetical protein n=1 Tax=Geothrix rubra TaxID=2927977 RepID=UPI0025563B6B|nr:hypothetical protein [Geothrix rubra]